MYISAKALQTYKNMTRCMASYSPSARQSLASVIIVLVCCICRLRVNLINCKTLFVCRKWTSMVMILRKSMEYPLRYETSTSSQLDFLDVKPQLKNHFTLL